MRVTGLFEKMENQRTNFPKCKDILDSSDEEDEEAQGSTFIEKTNKRSSAPTEELLFCQKQVLSIPESDSGGDEPILSKRAKTDILNRLKDPHQVSCLMMTALSATMLLQVLFVHHSNQFQKNW